MSTKDPPNPESGGPVAPTRRSILPPPPSSKPSPGPPSTRRPPSSAPAAPGSAPPSRTAFAPPPPGVDSPPLSARIPPSLPPPSALSTQLPTSTSKGTLPSSVQKALLTLDKLKAKLDTIERQRKEPVAIIGMACRFPAEASSPEAYFRVLLEGVDAVSLVPPGRFQQPIPAGDATMVGARWGSFLKEDVSLFDPSFFGISPREAERLDPQQRLLLELTWEALERGGQVPSQLIGSRTGVFVGLMTTDYMLVGIDTPEETWDGYAATGTAHCFPAGRIAYTFGFQGPTMVVDTACSSSLVATHLACQSLRTGEADMAIAGGANLMLSSVMSKMTARTNALSPDGRCKTFDARANGYVRGEGAGVLVLKRLSDAQRDGDPILAVIRGSAVNQDGRSTGLTTPNVLSQQAMLKQALSNARVIAEDIGYVETHGTGTPLGDPIELEALRAVLGARRESGLPCLLGAVKTNIGHLEAAAGVAGMMKAVLALQNETIPRNLHLKALNPRISLDGTPFKLPSENTPWPRGATPRFAGVSSFGLSGTNAHVILEEAPAEAPPEATEEGGDRATSGDPSRALPSFLLPLSAKTEEALFEMAGSYADMLSQPGGDPLYDVMYTAALRRTHHDHRLAVTGRSREEISAALAAFRRDGSAPGVLRGRAAPQTSQKVVFVFPGQGSQWVGMGQKLFREEPAFRASMELCHESIRRLGQFSLLDEIEATDIHSQLDNIHVVQSTIFAIQVSIAALLKSWGIEPDAVVGHSMGEVAAARVSGILSLEDAVKVICRRSLALERIVGQGAMGQVELSPQEAKAAIAGFESALSVAVHNGPRSTVLSGDPTALDLVLGKLESQGVFCRRVKVDVASHSPQVDVLKADLAAVLNLRPRTAQIPMYSTVTAAPLRGPELTAEYWVQNLREPVLFSEVTQRLMDERHTAFVEISPHPVLLNSIEENLQVKKHAGAAIPTLRRNSDEHRCMMEAVGALHVRGLPVGWKSLLPARGRSVRLPAYPWQRQRYWVESPRRAATPVEAAIEPLSEHTRVVSWREAPREPVRERSAGRGLGAWVVLDAQGGTGAAIEGALAERGQEVVRLTASSGPTSAADLRARIDSALRGSRCRGLVWLGALDAPRGLGDAQEMEAALRRGALGAVHAAQVLKGLSAGALYLVTRGAQPVEGRVESPAQGALWGVGRTLLLEAGRNTTLVDLDPAGGVDGLVEELLSRTEETQLVFRNGRRYVPRLERVRLEDQAPALRPDGTYLITGGLGGLGLALAEWLARVGARSLVLAGRRPPGREAAEKIDALRKQGITVEAVQLDVTRAEDVEALVQRLPTLRGVVHAAARLPDGTRLLHELDDDAAFLEELRPKTLGALHLHQATRGRALDFFVLYSSFAGLVGAPGLIAYSAGNAFLDALACARADEGLPALSVQWGQFADAGAGRDPARIAALAAQGIGTMEHAEAMEALGKLLARPRPVVALGRLSLDRLASAYGQSGLRDMEGSDPRNSPVRRDVVVSSKGSGPVATGGKGPPEEDPLEALSTMTDEERSAHLQRLLKQQVGRLLRVDPARIPDDQPLGNLGFDSLMGMELRGWLDRSLHAQLGMAEIMSNPWITAIAALVDVRLGAEPAARTSEASPPARTSAGPPPARTSEAPPAPVTARSLAPRPPGSWVVVPKPNPAARMRLFCFPYAGGSASIFATWGADLPPEIELCAIQYPGRHERMHEALPKSVDEMVREIVPALMPYLDKPFAVFGHCLGAIVMFESLRELWGRHGKAPLQVFASAAPPPRRYMVPSVASLSRAEFTDLLRALGFAQESVLSDADAEQHLLPAVRSDFGVAAAYARLPGDGIEAPLTVFAGLADGFAPAPVVEQWKQETTGRFSAVTFPGGHYFIVPERAALLRHMSDELLFRLASQEQRAAARSIESWVVRPAPRPRPALRLFVFPGLGQSSLEYADWPALFGERVEVVVVEAPGRGARLGELPVASVTEMASYAARAVQLLADVPFAFVGQDLGALVLFEAARRLRREEGPMPEHAIVSSAMAPDVHYFAPTHHLRPDTLRAELGAFGVRAAAPERTLRADCACLTSYAYVLEPPLQVPSSVLVAEDDAFIPSGAVRGWTGHMHVNSQVIARPGVHGWTAQDKSTAASLVSRLVARLLTASGNVELDTAESAPRTSGAASLGDVGPSGATRRGGVSATSPGLTGRADR